MTDLDLDVVTGALSFTGRHITRHLLASGRRVRTLTGTPDRDQDLASELEVVPYRFDDPVALADSLRGATTLYNTYWIRFRHGAVTFDSAVANSRALFAAARRAGVQRIVHISITNPSLSSRLPYFRGKALVEQALVETGLPYAIVRPTVVFGPGDVMLNNIAWLLRHLPVFAVAGSGDYPVRPVHVDDVARLCVEASASPNDATVVDAVGPETFTFVELVELLRQTVGSRARIVSLPTPLVGLLSRIIGVFVGDVLLTPQELQGLVHGLASTAGPATGEISLSRWLADQDGTFGLDYASELARHYDGGRALWRPRSRTELRHPSALPTRA